MTSRSVIAIKKFAVSNTALEPKFQYVNKTGDVVILDELAYSGDSNFNSDGRYLTTIGSDVITGDDSTPGEAELPQTYAVPFPKLGEILSVFSVRALLPDEKVIVEARVTSGSANLQVTLKGQRIPFARWEQMVRAAQKYLEQLGGNL